MAYKRSSGKSGTGKAGSSKRSGWTGMRGRVSDSRVPPGRRGGGRR